MAVRFEVVDLRAVGGVVVDHDQHPQAQLGDRLEVRETHQRAAIAERGTVSPSGHATAAQIALANPDPPAWKT
jgi:hypothetical protein